MHQFSIFRTHKPMSWSWHCYACGGGGGRVFSILALDPKNGRRYRKSVMPEPKAFRIALRDAYEHLRMDMRCILAKTWRSRVPGASLLEQEAEGTAVGVTNE